MKFYLKMRNTEEETVLFHTKFKKVKVNILNDNIEEQATDVIVNPTDPNMTSNSGVAYSIISKAGKKVFYSRPKFYLDKKTM